MNEIKSKRLNRAQVEWMRVLKPVEYVLLDKMLFQANLTDANNGTGYLFHVRQLERECNISRSTVSEALNTFPFIIKNGYTSKMSIQLDYDKFIEWITVRLMNRTVRHPDSNCPPGEPISRKEESTCTKTLLGANALDLIIPLNNELLKKVGNDSVSNNINTPSAVSVGSLSQHGAAPHNKETTVRLMDSDCKYIVEDDPVECPLPKGIKNIPSPFRNKQLVKLLNIMERINLAVCSKGYQREGYSFTAIDDINKYLLITADDKDFIDNPKTQRMIKHFKDKEYKVRMWVGSNESVYRVIKEKGN